jgi:hypothetical protein
VRTKKPTWLTVYVGVAVLIAVFQSLGSLVVMHRHGGLWTELHEGDRLVGDLADIWVVYLAGII